MSMSKYMHPRNIYKTPPNFKQLAIQYPEFRKHVTQELSGKVFLDFKDVSALRALTCTLLKKDFQLDVDIPLNKLIPTIPLRLNYILWVEDLIEISGKTDRIKGVDIGTGASCVYPLIAAKKYHWSMIATEVDDESVKYAEDNVNRNGLNDSIKVVKVNENTLLKEVVLDDSFDFCMCNPPFFSTHKETVFEFKSRKESRPKPRNAFSGAHGEVIVKGGEVEFIARLMYESKELRENVRIFTTMIGHKVSLAPLKKLLREIDVISFKQTEFCQGNTTRWGLAWTFYDIDLRKVPEATLAAARKHKKKNPVQYKLSPPWNELGLEDVGSRIRAIFDKLEIEYKLLKHSKNVLAYTATAHTNTWSHQRRKKREHLHHVNKSDSSDASSTMDQEITGESVANDKQTEILRSPDSPSVEAATDLISEMKVKSPGSAKRELEDDEGYYNNKRIKLEAETESVNVAKHYVECTILIRRDGKGTHFEIIWVDGFAGRDTLQQILQYFKNNLKLEN